MNQIMRYWLMKSEPETYAIDDLKREERTPWEGVRNYQARNFMRDEMQVGDRVIFYHSSTKAPAAVGEGRVCSEPYPDSSQFNKKSSYFEPRARREQPVWMLVDICYVQTFRFPVSLARMRTDQRFKGMRLLERGARLSVMPLEQKHFERILLLAGT